VVHVLSAIAPDADHHPSTVLDGHLGRSQVRLTARELEVLTTLAEGKGTTRIAGELGVSVHTVRNHLDRLFKKLRAHSRLEVVATARRLGLIR
jgi:DNA-binding CsgD family transcriptional regulator